MIFYDTCALLDLQQKAFKSKFFISSITLKELETIKTSKTKDEETRWAARQILKLLSENEDKYETIIYKSSYDNKIKEVDFPLTEDSKIICCAIEAFSKSNEEGIFITKDLACKKLADCIGLKTQYLQDKKDDQYTGYLTIDMDEEELANFYNILIPEEINKYNLLINQYLLINFNNKIEDIYKWTIEGYKKITFNKIESNMFGKISPINGDSYQQCALDSLCHNQITVMRGKAGSGKSYLALGYLISQLEKGKIDKIVIFVNSVAVRGAAKLGFYPGSKDSKLLDSQIGNFLASKFGSITEAERMIDDGNLILIPVADCRGMDTTGIKAGVLVTEAQNLSRDMIKLILQRIGEDSKVVIEGDDNAQVDMAEYAGSNNGLRALSQIFRGEDLYGEVTLQNIYRSRIAEIAERI